MKPFLAALAFGAVVHAAAAAPTPAPVRAEIDAVLAKLQSSGCQFERNGSWYSAPEARTHLLRKLEYIERRGTIESAEQFIALAAARSSSSGKPYRVRCGAETAVESQQWLGRQLEAIRASATPPCSAPCAAPSRPRPPPAAPAAGSSPR